jgi:hypothetical protein
LSDGHQSALLMATLERMAIEGKVREIGLKKHELCVFWPFCDQKSGHFSRIAGKMAL